MPGAACAGKEGFLPWRDGLKKHRVEERKCCWLPCRKQPQKGDLPEGFESGTERLFAVFWCHKPQNTCGRRGTVPACIWHGVGYQCWVPVLGTSCGYWCWVLVLGSIPTGQDAGCRVRGFSGQAQTRGTRGVWLSLDRLWCGLFRHLIVPAAHHTPTSRWLRRLVPQFSHLSSRDEAVKHFLKRP